MKRIFDVTLGIILLAVMAMPMLFIALAVKLTSREPALYWSERVGKNGVPFMMPKFRSMKASPPPPLPASGGHLMTEPEMVLPPIGGFLRRTSLDELPQLFSILKGDMSFVGPRPIVPQEEDFIALREAHGVHQILPGLTGWAQINGRDTLNVAEKVALDVEYMQKQSFWFDLKITCMTLGKVITQEGVSHHVDTNACDDPLKRL